MGVHSDLVESTHLRIRHYANDEARGHFTGGLRLGRFPSHEERAMELSLRRHLRAGQKITGAAENIIQARPAVSAVRAHEEG